MTCHIRRLLVGAALALLLVLPRAATAQAQLPDHVLKTLQEVCKAYPYPVVQADEHLGEILNLVAWTHRAEGWGLSRKTGGRHVDSPVGPIAEDILQLPNGNHYDVLGAAEVGAPLRPGAGRNIGTINLRDRPWVAPVEHRPSWLSANGPSNPTPDPGPSPNPTPTPAPVDLGPVLRELAAIRNELTSLREIRVSKDDLEAQTAVLYKLIAEQLIGEHVSDIKARIDVVRVTLEQFIAWLKSRSILRF